MPRTVGEEVSIASVQFTERELPLWATERTQKQIAKVIAGGAKNQGALLKNIDKNIAALSGGLAADLDFSKEQLDALNELSGAVQDSNQSDQKQHREQGRWFTRLGKHFEATKREIKDVFDPTFLQFRLPDISRIVTSLGTSVAFAVKNMLPFGKTILTIVGLTGILFNKLQDTNSTFRQLTEFGVDFNSVLDTGGDRLQAFGITAAESNLTISEFADALTRFSRVAARIGEKNFGVLAREVADTLRPVGMLGLRMDELTEFTGSYLEQQRMLGLLSLQTRAQQVEAAAENIKMLTAFAKVTGVARKEMQKMAETALAREELIAFIHSLPPEMRTMMEQNVRIATTQMAGVFGEQAEVLMSPFSELLRRGMLISEQSINLVGALPRTLQPALNDYVNTIKNAQGDQKVISEATLKLAEDFGTVSDDTMRWLGILADNGNQAAKELIPLIAHSRDLASNMPEFRKRMEESAKAAEEEAKHRADISDGLTLWEDTLKRLRLIGERVVFGFLGMPSVTGAVRGGLTLLEGAIEGLTTWLEKVITNSFPAMQKAIDSLTKWFQSFFKDGELDAQAMFDDIWGRVKVSFVKMLDLLWEALKQAIVEWWRGEPEKPTMVTERQALLEKAAKEREAAGGPTPRTRAQIVADMGPLEDRVEAMSKKLPDPGPPGPGNMPPKAKIVVEPPPPVEEPRSWFRTIFGGGGAKRAPVPGPGAMPGRATTPRPTPVTIVTNEEKEENNPNNEQPRSNLPGPRRPLNNNGSPIRSAEELLQETTELLRATLELGVRQTKIMEDTKNQMRNLQQGLY